MGCVLETTWRMLAFNWWSLWGLLLSTQSSVQYVFFALRQHKNSKDMIPEIREPFEAVNGESRLAWSIYLKFCNHFKYILQPYWANVITNLTTYAGKRLRQYLRLINRFDSTQNDPHWKVAVRWSFVKHCWHLLLIVLNLRISNGRDNFNILRKSWKSQVIRCCVWVPIVYVFSHYIMHCVGFYE